MIRFVIALMVAGMCFTVTAIADDDFTLGSSSFSVPIGWTKTNKTDERLTFRSSDDHQQATVSSMSFNANPTFEDFKRICSMRYKSEKEGSAIYQLSPIFLRHLRKKVTTECFFQEKKKGKSGFLRIFKASKKRINYNLR